ncbi:MAG TPA: hypothetical protein PKD93_02460, partial [Ferruginibacter sp.]|nr:hypothetical protein [Ferruginibacter sp.]
AREVRKLIGSLRQLKGNTAEPNNGRSAGNRRPQATRVDRTRHKTPGQSESSLTFFAESGALYPVSSSVSIINPPAKQAAIQVAATAADKE